MDWYYKNHARQLEIACGVRLRAKMAVFNHYSNGNPKCACCGEKQIKFLQLDHINGGGTKERILHGAGTGVYCYLRKNNYPKGYQILCANCNFAKGLYGQCPHKK